MPGTYGAHDITHGQRIAATAHRPRRLDATGAFCILSGNFSQGDPKMRSFLSLYRKLHISSLRSYTPYAIGEIVVVVIGILIALEVNNYNASQKKTSQEKRALLSLHYEIENNVKTLDRSIQEKQTIVRTNH